MRCLSLGVTRLAKANGVRWHRHVLRRNSDDVLKRASDSEAVGRKGHGRSKMTWKTQVEKRIGLKTENVINRTKWRNDNCELLRA